MDDLHSAGTRSGFTLFELMLALLALAVLLVIAAPSLGMLRDTVRLQADTRRFLAAIQLARSEAIRRNQAVSLCPAAVQVTGTVSCADSYARGWMVFANADGDRVVDAGEDQLLRVFAGLRPGFELRNRSGTRVPFETVTYRPDGSSSSNRTFLFCPPPGSRAQPLAVVVNIMGRARLAKDWGRCLSA